MEMINYVRNGDELIIGEEPRLIVNLRTQNNYVRVGEKLFLYNKEIRFSRDLLAGKRRQVMNTAVSYFYHQACEIAEGLEIAEDYRQRANTTIREMK